MEERLRCAWFWGPSWGCCSSPPHHTLPSALRFHRELGSADKQLVRSGVWGGMSGGGQHLSRCFEFSARELMFRTSHDCHFLYNFYLAVSQDSETSGQNLSWSNNEALCWVWITHDFSACCKIDRWLSFPQTTPLEAHRPSGSPALLCHSSWRRKT